MSGLLIAVNFEAYPFVRQMLGGVAVEPGHPPTRFRQTIVPQPSKPLASSPIEMSDLAQQAPVPASRSKPTDAARLRQPQTPRSPPSSSGPPIAKVLVTALAFVLLISCWTILQRSGTSEEVLEEVEAPARNATLDVLHTVNNMSATVSGLQNSFSAYSSSMSEMAKDAGERDEKKLALLESIASSCAKNPSEDTKLAAAVEKLSKVFLECEDLNEAESKHSDTVDPSPKVHGDEDATAKTSEVQGTTKTERDQRRAKYTEIWKRKERLSLPGNPVERDMRQDYLYYLYCNHKPQYDKLLYDLYLYELQVQRSGFESQHEGGIDP